MIIQNDLIGLYCNHDSYLHTQVYEAIIMTIEKMDDRTSAMMCELLGSLHRAIIITPSQMKAGFLRVSLFYYFIVYHCEIKLNLN